MSSETELDTIRLRDTDGSSDDGGPVPETEEETAENDVEDTTQLLPLSVKLSYGAPQFATMSLTFLINVYGNRFYTQMGATLSSLAFFTALARSLDVMTDPLMGWWRNLFCGSRAGVAGE